MKQLSKEEMKKLMGGVMSHGHYIVSCTFEAGYSGSFGSCSGSQAACQQAADDWCGQAQNHCKSCSVGPN